MWTMHIDNNNELMNEWMTIYPYMWTHREGATLNRNAYNELYSGNFFECMLLFNDSLDNWRISLMADRYYLY